MIEAVEVEWCYTGAAVTICMTYLGSQVRSASIKALIKSSASGSGPARSDSTQTTQNSAVTISMSCF